MAGVCSLSSRRDPGPEFAFEPGSLVIRAGREGLDGCWKKTFPVSGGRHYHFSADYQAKEHDLPRRSCSPRSTGGTHGAERSAWISNRSPDTSRGQRPWPRRSSPRRRRPTREAGPGCRTPTRPRRARPVELAPHGPGGGEAAEDVSAETSPPPPAARPAGDRPLSGVPARRQESDENRRMYEPLVAAAARQKADLVVLGETLTFVGAGQALSPSWRNPFPGPSTEYFGQSCGEHNVYLVAWPCSSGTARWCTTSGVLIDPEGKGLVGKAETSVSRGRGRS